MPLEEDIKQKNRLYETMLSHTPDLVYVFDTSERFTYANNALLKMWGKTWEEAAYKTCLELGYEPWHAEMHGREIQQVIKTKMPIRGEVPFNGTNGKRIYDYIFMPVFGENGEVEAIAGTTRDVTERKNLEESSVNSVRNASLLSAIIASSDDAIISKDLNGNITSWNPASERIFGFTAQEAIGKHISIIIPSDKLHEEDHIIAQIKSGNKIEHFETERQRKDGKRIFISVTISPVKDYNGTIVGASKVARDIGAIREASTTSAYLGAIIESSDDAIISKDLNGFVTSWNKSAEHIFGYAAGEILGKHISILIPPERLAEEEKILSTLRDGKKIEHFETMRRHKKGHLIPVSLTVSPIRDYSGKIIGASKISRDISDRLKIEQALKETNDKKEEFLTNMSHELRTPMNAVIGLANILKKMPDLPKASIKYIDTLKTSADHLMDLINDLLDFSKIETGVFEVETIEFDLAKQIEDIMSVMSVRAEQKKLNLSVNYQNVFHKLLLGDRLRVSQILTNLLANAIKFTEKGYVQLDIHADTDSTTKQMLITFKVTDTGIGIAHEKLDSIFEKFTQADSSITRKYGGSGLGLAITKNCVERMGGTIQVESEIGLGTVFTVQLPFGITNTGSNVEPLPLKASTSSSITDYKNILLVDDYEPNVLVASVMIQQLGCSFEIASNGIEAIHKFSHGQYDLVLMDVQMSELDGLEATRRIRLFEQGKSLQRTPIIAMTAHVREQDKDRCFQAGMDDFIPKPFEMNELEKKITKYINFKNPIAQNT